MPEICDMMCSLTLLLWLALFYRMWFFVHYPPLCTQFCYLQKSGTLALWALCLGMWRASRFPLGRGDFYNSYPCCLPPRCQAPFRSLLTKPTLAVWSCNWNPVLAPNLHPSTDFDVSLLPHLLSRPALPPTKPKIKKRHSGIEPEKSVRLFHLGPVVCSLESPATQGPVGQAPSSCCAP